MKPWFDAPKPTMADLVAGVSVALVLIPQSLAYAQIAEMPAVTGLFASALPLIAFSLLASSPYLQTGPVALTSLLTLAALQGAGFTSDDPEYVKLAALLAFIVGACRLLLGVGRLGWLAYLIVEPVRRGFTSAAAIIIISSQLPKAMGTAATAPESSTLGQALWSVSHPGAWAPADLLLAAITLAVMLGGRRVHRLFPGVAVAVVIGLVFSGVVGDDTVLTVGDFNPIPEGLPSLSLDLPWSSVGTLVVGGLIIALVGFAEPASIARQFAMEDKARWDANRELAGSGLANLTAAVSGAFPVGGSFSRSSINRLAGARTRWSGGLTGLVVLAFLPFASVLDGLPLAVIGAIVIGAVLSLVKPKVLGGLWRQSRTEAVLAWCTFVATLAVSPALHWAVVLGVALTTAVHLARPLQLHTVGLDGPAGGTTVKTATDVTVKVTGLLWPASYGAFEQRLRAAADDNPSADIVVDLGHETGLDPSVESAMQRVTAELNQAGRTLSVTGRDHRPSPEVSPTTGAATGAGGRRAG
ncbi:MAG: SulP family inorganic anion transporter [Acidimicrobiales bacterium]